MTHPRVTEILKPLCDFSHIPSGRLERAATRGTVVHAVCASLSRNEFVAEQFIHPDYVPYIEAFKKWQDSSVNKYILIEKRIVDHYLGFSGQPDAVITTKEGQTYLVDYKTCYKPQRYHPVQMAAYKKLLRHHDFELDGAMLVYLGASGEYPYVKVLEDLTEETNVFNAAFSIYKYMHPKASTNEAVP